MTGGWSNPFSSMTMIYMILAAVTLNELFKVLFICVYISVVLCINSVEFAPIVNYLPWTGKWLGIFIETFVGFSVVVIVSFLKTAMLKVEKELQALKMKVSDVIGSRAIGALSGGVCHRIASPLNNIKLRIDRLYDRLDCGIEKDLESIELSISKIEERLRS